MTGSCRCPGLGALPRAGGTRRCCVRHRTSRSPLRTSRELKAGRRFSATRPSVLSVVGESLADWLNFPRRDTSRRRSARSARESKVTVVEARIRSSSCPVECCRPSRPTRPCSRSSGTAWMRSRRTSRCTPRNSRRRTTTSAWRLRGSCARPTRMASSGSTSSAIRGAARLRSPSPPSMATGSSVSRSSNRHGPATTGRRKRTPCGSDSRRSRRCRPTSSWRDSCGCNSRPVWSHRHLRKARRHRGWRSGQRVYEPSSTRSTRRSRPRALRAVRPARLLRARRPQQPRLLRSDGRTGSRRSSPTSRSRRSPTPSLRPASPHRAGTRRRSLLALWQRAQSKSARLARP